MRTAQSSPIGTDLIGFVRRPDVQAELKRAAEEGVPPVMAVSELALASFPRDTFEDNMNKRRLGLLIAGVLDEAGFEPARSNVRIRNNVFASGTTYRRKRSILPQSSNFVSRLVEFLSEDEADELIDGLISRFPSLQNKMRR